MIQNAGTTKVTLILFGVLFYGVTFYSAIYDFKQSPSTQFELSTGNNNGWYTLIEGNSTHFKFLEIEGKGTFEINQFWLLPSFSKIQNEQEFAIVQHSETLLKEAMNYPTYVIADDGSRYRLVFSKQRSGTASFSFLLHKVIALCVLSLMFVVLWLKPKINGALVLFVVTAICLWLGMSISISGIERQWALDFEQLIWRYNMGNLLIRSVVTTPIILLWFYPNRLFKSRAVNVCFPVTLIAVNFFHWLFFLFKEPSFTGFYFSYIYMFDVAMLLMVTALQINATRKKDTIADKIAMRWLIIIILIVKVCLAVNNMMWYWGWLDIPHNNILNGVVILLFCVGLAGVALKPVFYRMNSLWWSFWTHLAFVVISLLVYFLLGGTSYEQLQRIILLVIVFSSAYFMFTNAVNKKRGVSQFKLIDSMAYDLNELSKLPEQSDVFLDKWTAILEKVFKPNTIKFKEERVDKIEIRNEGEHLHIPHFNHSLQLSGAFEGKKLFYSEDARLVAVFQKIAFHQHIVKNAFLSGEESTRKQIAQDIHDDIAGRLYSIANAESIEQEYVNHTLNQLRLLTRGIYKNKQLVEDFFADISYEFHHRLKDKRLEFVFDFDVSPECFITGYDAASLGSILSELLRNALQHSKPSRIFIDVSQQKHALQICVSSNGAVTQVEHWDYGLGINSIKRRIHQNGGEVLWHCNPSGGVTVSIHYQLKSD